MDKSLALRLDENSSHFESALYRKLAKLGRDYVQAGLSTLDYYTPDFDISNDMANCFGTQMRTGWDFEKRDRNAPDNFLHPMAATEIATLTTFVSQILFGGETTRRVEPRKPEDEEAADLVNELLAWNDAQQPTYNQGYHWIWDAITFNRGVLYDHWQDMMTVTLEPVEVELPYEPPIDPETGKKIRKPKDWKPEIVTRFRKKRTKIGGFCKVSNISPYDFICDPTMPMNRFQESRFAGHRVIIPWSELKRRSELPIDDYQYVLPKVVEKLKNSKGRKVTSISTGTTTSISRSFFERQRRGMPVTTLTGSDKIDKEDGGVVECFCIQVRCVPKTYNIYDDEEQELIELLISGEQDLLSVNVITNKHDEYPYAVGEARPNAHQQFSPSWALIIKGPQDYVDYLKNRHKESLARTTGNIFIGNPTYVDFEAFTDPKKDGLFIPVTEAGEGKPIDQIIKQIPIVDMTAKFHEEMLLWIKTAEDATGAHAATQGQQRTEGDTTATEFVGTQQMATGRISTIARLLSASALVPQTERIISNMQQWLPDTMVIRITGSHDEFDPDQPQENFATIIRDKSALPDGLGKDEEGNLVPRSPLLDKDIPDIQGEFEVIVHDGSLPGTDAKKVAALSRAVEAYSNNPALAPVFDRTIPGAIDPFKLFRKLLKASGFPIGGLSVDREEAQKNLQQAQLAAGMGTPVSMAGAPPAQPPPAGAPPPAPMTPTGAGNIPSAAALPPTPTAAPPEVRPESA